MPDHPVKERLREHYDKKYAHEAISLSISVSSYTPWPRNRFEACVKFFPRAFKGGDILELGAGSGNIAMSLKEQNLDFASYTLSDFSSARLQGMVQTANDPRFRVVELDADVLPDTGLGPFDAIIAIALIEHLMDPISAMRHVRSLLKPGGFLYVDTPNIAKYTRRVRLLFGRFPSTAASNEGLTTYDGCETDLFDEGHLHYFTFRSLSKMLQERCGFSRVERCGYCCSRSILGHRAENFLAEQWPQVFSETTLIAYA